MDKNKFSGKSDEAVKKATGKTWDEWFTLLDAKGARDMSHKDLARMLYDEGLIKSGWWCQSVTVGYEQKIGRRVVGQIAEGNFSTATSITLEGTMDSVLKQWEELIRGKAEFNKVKIKGEPRISVTDKWRYWKVDLVDGSKINVDISEKESGKTGLSVTHFKLKDKESADKWKVYWKELLGKI